MGMACTRVIERTLASAGQGGPAAARFEPACDVAQGGVLWALPALESNGLLKHLERLGAINREATALQELLHRSGGPGGAEVRQALGHLGQRIAQMRGEWERPPHKPVMQRSMDAGSVELF